MICTGYIGVKASRKLCQNTLQQVLNIRICVSGDVSFEELAKALHKQGSKDGQGNTLAYAARDSGGHLSPFAFDRRELRDDDVRIQITHCGICHSDLHQIKNEWHGSNYPMVPG